MSLLITLFLFLSNVKISIAQLKANIHEGEKKKNEFKILSLQKEEKQFQKNIILPRYRRGSRES